LEIILKKGHQDGVGSSDPSVGSAKDQMWVTIYLDDDEAFDLWRKIVPEDRIVRLGRRTIFGPWAIRALRTLFGDCD